MRSHKTVRPASLTSRATAAAGYLTKADFASNATQLEGTIRSSSH